MLVKVKMIASLIVLLMIFFACEIPAQVDTSDQDTTTIYPDTTSTPDTTTINPDSLNYESRLSVIQKDIFEITPTYYVIRGFYILPKDNAIIRKDKNLRST